MTYLFREPEDATPLEPQEREGLLQSWITHRKDLNEAEQENIVEAAAWARRLRRISLERLLSIDFMQAFHKRMFGDVWQWAGTFRTTERNIGIQAYRIAMELAALLDDVRFWIEHDTYPPMRSRSGFITASLRSIRFRTETDAMRGWQPICSLSGLAASYSPGAAEAWQMSGN